FWVLLWAAIHSLLTSFSLVRSERTTIATEQIATAKPLKLASPDSFTGAPDKVEGFFNALTLYRSAQRIIFALSLVKGGTGDIASNWADLQRKHIVDHRNGVPNTFTLAPGAIVAEFTSYFQYTSSKDEAQKKLTSCNRARALQTSISCLQRPCSCTSSMMKPAPLLQAGLNQHCALRCSIYASTHYIPKVA
ncbi:hypothetical protein B0H17DRAFT_1079361, partial [Mycena rosella]